MGLTNPLLLAAGLGLISIPILVHLQMRRQRKRVVFSSLKLIEASQRISKRRRRIKNWPLFLMRCLIVSLLGFVFARPFIKDFMGGGSRGRETVVFVLDQSASMQAHGEVGSAWDEALGKLTSALQQTNPASKVALLLSPGNASKQEVRFRPPKVLLAEVEKLTAGFGSANLAADLQRAASALSRVNDTRPRVIHLISDLQTEETTELDQVQVPSTVAIRVDKVGDLRARNAGLTGAVLGQGELRRGIYQVRGDTDRDGEVSIRDVDDQGNAVGDPFVVSFGGDRQTVVHAYTASDSGWYRRRVELSGPPSSSTGAASWHTDAFKLDDTLYDAFFVEPRIHVVLLEPDPSAKTFEQRTFLLSRSLDPVFYKKSRGEKQTHFVPHVVPMTTSAVRKVLSKCKGEPTVFMVPGTNRVTRELGDLLTTFVEQGGSCILFGGDDMRPANYHRYLGEILPVELQEVENIDVSVTLAPVPKNHPLWGGLDEGNRLKLRTLPLFKRCRLKKRDDAEVLALYVDAVPLVVQRSHGKGRVMFVNASANREWGDWPTLGNLFVPTVHILAASAINNTASSWRDEQVQLVVDEISAIEIGKHYAGQQVTIDKQPYSVTAAGRVEDFIAQQPGFFDVKSATGDVLRQLVANIPPAESNLECIQEVVVKSQLESQRVDADASDEAATVRADTDAKDNSFWKGLLALVVIGLAVEPWYANRL